MAPDAEHAEELSRAISEVNLTSTRHPIDALPEYGPVHSRDEMLSLRFKKQDEHLEHVEMAEGMTTPPGPPAPPAPTPESLDTALEDTQLEERDANAVLPSTELAKKKKKKNKKSSGKNRKPAPTGFEGLCSFSKSDD